jgi:heme-degrading monooxygenase HmoA
MLHAKVQRDKEEEFLRAFGVVTDRMQHAAGHIQDELIREVVDSDQPSYVVLSEWESVDEFLAWLRAPAHQGEDSPLSDLWYDTRVQIFELTKRLEKYDPVADHSSS